MNAQRRGFSILLGGPMEFETKHTDITEKIIKAFYAVYNQLGYGFSERVYENSMVIECQVLGLIIEQQKPIAVYYRGSIVGEYFVDLLVNRVVIVEFKSVGKLMPEHEAQLLNYLKATPIEVGLLMNFGPKPEFQRRAFDNSRKGPLAWTDWKQTP